MVTVVESTGAVFTVAFAQVMALWRKSEVVMREVNEREADLECR